MTKKLPYERYPIEEKADGFPTPYEEMTAWQEKQVAFFRERSARRWGRFFFVLRCVFGGLVGLAVAGAIVYGLVRLNNYSQDQYYLGFSTWASNCQEAGGRVAGNYNDTSSQTCVFPGGAQLTRSIPQ